MLSYSKRRLIRPSIARMTSDILSSHRSIALFMRSRLICARHKKKHLKMKHKTQYSFFLRREWLSASYSLPVRAFAASPAADRVERYRWLLASVATIKRLSINGHVVSAHRLPGDVTAGHRPRNMLPRGVRTATSSIPSASTIPSTRRSAVNAL